MQPKLAVILAGLVGCVDPGTESLPATSLELSPAMLTVTVIDGRPVVQPYVATLVATDGTRVDVTADTTFALASDAFGTWDGATLALSGAAVGPTHVRATYDDALVDGELTVFARTTHIDASAPAGAPELFDRADVEPTCAPAIAYPAADAILPRNLGDIEVHWNDARDDLFEIHMSTEYVDVRVYTRGADPSAPYYSQVPAADWQRISSQPGPIELRVSGMIEALPDVECQSAARSLRTTQPLSGALYFWTPDAGIYRKDMTNTQQPSAPVFDAVPTVHVTETARTDLTSCGGCAFSTSGTRMAIPAYQLPHGSIYDFTAHSMLVPTDGATARAWESATFTADGGKLITAEAGELTLITDAGAQLATLPRSPNLSAVEPQLSPDGSWLANVETGGNSAYVGSSIVVRRYDDVSDSFGPQSSILTAENGVSVYNLAWSPDGQWLAFTRATGWGTLSVTASVWVMKADRSLVPRQVTATTTDLDIAARWAPEQYTSNTERLFYLTYSSSQPIGALDTAVSQVWMQPFFPDRALAKEPASGAAIRLPFQSRTATHRFAGWTRAAAN